MNDEIKEILEELENMYEISELEEQVNNINKIRDYITNLQQIEQDHKETNATLMSELAKLEEENERLKHQLKVQEDLTIKNRMRKHIYKSRCEKASEKLGNYKHYSTPTEEQNSENEDIVDSVLNILQNGSDNSEY